MTDEITIPPFPKMGGHGGEPEPPPKMGGHGGEPTPEPKMGGHGGEPAPPPKMGGHGAEPTEEEKYWAARGWVTLEKDIQEIVKWWPKDLRITIRMNDDGTAEILSDSPRLKQNTLVKRKK
jgi:hypothetical protein